MIIWLASYPKSGNTWVRSFLSAYYHSSDGIFNFDLLNNIKQYPKREFFDQKIDKPGEINNFWQSSQEKIISNKKINILKTHNALIKINNNAFTSTKYTLGVIYILRDPRNILTSLTNHYQMNYEEALAFMTNEKKYIYDNRLIDDVDYSDFHYLSSWSNHYKSWSKNNLFKKIIIKYEDLLEKPHLVFNDLIVFINQLSQINKNVDAQKFTNAINSTNFKSLQNLEKTKNFSEGIYSNKDKSKIKFFNLGVDNKWKKKIPKNMHDTINKTFKNVLQNLNYI